MQNTTGRIVAGLAFAVLGACSDGSGPGDTLTEAEADALLTIIDTKVSESKEVQVDSAGKFALVVPCLFKGEVAASGTFVAVEDSTKASYDTDMKMAYSKCRQGSDAGVFVLDGTVSEVSSDKYDLVAPSRTLDSHLTGDLEWSLDKTSGSCAIDLTLTVRATATTQSSDVTGTFCGTPYPRP